MANTYTHRVVSLRKSNGVYLNTINSAIIEVTVSDGTDSFSHEYTTILAEPMMGDNFTQYPEVTESQVISWFTENEIEYEFVKIDIDNKLKESLQDNVESNFPWSQQAS